MGKMIPNRLDAYQLVHEGAIALAKAERHGICVDTRYCKRKLKELGEDINNLFRELLEDEDVQEWKKKKGKAFNITSDEQLSDFLYKDLKIKPKRETEGGFGSVDYESLKAINLPFVSKILETRKIKTGLDDLHGIMREQVRGRIHPNYTLHFADTYRSSCRDPNLQNMPIRDPDLGETIRRAFLASYGNLLGEIDYGGIEVHGACWYHKDPTMMDYLSGEGDMHADMAAQIYMLGNPPAKWWKDKTRGHGKDVRYTGKNKYVFPEFYGSYYVECAMNLWNAILDMNLVNPDGLGLKKHLANKGIRNFQAFEKHIEKVEEDFWGNRFPVYSQWKDDWHEEYLINGYIDTLTGFRCSGEMRRNQVINYPVQGVAFQCLLWAFTQITKEAEKRQWVTRPILQIHDSIILDIYPPELIEVMDTCKKIMIDDLKKHWDFIITPIEIEAETTPINGTWHDKKDYEFDVPF